MKDKYIPTKIQKRIEDTVTNGLGYAQNSYRPFKDTDMDLTMHLIRMETKTRPEIFRPLDLQNQNYIEKISYDSRRENAIYTGA